MKKSILFILLALIMTTSVHGTRYITDILLIGGNWDEVCQEEKKFQAQGWETINKDLNEGCGENSDYIYLMAKYEESNGVNYGYITDLYLWSSELVNGNELLRSGGTVYYLTPYFGGSHFRNKKGNLNSHTGDNSDNIYLFYTKTPKDNKALTSITFNDTKSGAVGKNGDNRQGYDLNCGARGSYIYMHTTSAPVISATLSGSGSSLVDPIIISSAAEWATFSTKTNNADYESSYLYVKLASDIPNEQEKAAGKIAVTNMVGDKIPAWIYFDGNNHKITVNINNVISGTAPFASTDQSRIENLTIDGSVTSTNNHAAGLIGLCYGSTIIQNCHISADVNTPTYAGGIVGHGGNNNYKLIINKCYYDGTISGFNNYAGGLLGWCDNVEILIADCLFKGSFQPGKTGQYHPIACKHAPSNVTVTVGKAYYLETVDLMNIGSNAIPGLQAIKVSPNSIPGVANSVYEAPDGNNYYFEYCAHADILKQLVKDYAGKKASLGFDYKVTKDFPELICLPIKMSHIENGTLYQLTGFRKETQNGKDIWTATFYDVTPDQDLIPFTEPGVPYLFMPDITGTVNFFGDIDRVPQDVNEFQPLQMDAGNGWKLYGVYSDVPGNTINGYTYFCANATVTNMKTGEVAYKYNIFIKAEKETIKAFDAYVSYYTEESGADIPSMVLIELIDKNGNSTAVGTINTETGEITIDRWYSIDGTPLMEQPTEPGIYIHNGKKIAIQ